MDLEKTLMKAAVEEMKSHYHERNLISPPADTCPNALYVIDW